MTLPTALTVPVEAGLIRPQLPREAVHGLLTVSPSTMTELSWVTLACRSQGVGGKGDIADNLQGAVLILMAHAHRKTQGVSADRTEIMTLSAPLFK